MYLSCILVAYFPGSTAQVCELLEDKDQCYSYLCSPALSTPSTRLRALDIPEHSADTWYAELEKERSSLLVQAMSLGSQPARCLLGGLRDSTGGGWSKGEVEGGRKSDSQIGSSDDMWREICLGYWHVLSLFGIFSIDGHSSY